MDFIIYDDEKLNEEFNEKMLYLDLDDKKAVLDFMNSHHYPKNFKGFNTDDIYDICIKYLNIVDNDCYFQDNETDLKVFNFLSAYAWQHRGE